MLKHFLLVFLFCLSAVADTNTLTDKVTGETITQSFFNDIHDALSGTVVPRNSSGVPTTGGGDLGSSTYRWGTIYGAAGDLSGLQTWSLARTSTYGSSYHSIAGNIRLATNTIIGASGGGYPYIGYNVRATSTTNQYQYDANDSAALLQFGTGAAAGFYFKYAGSGTAGNTMSDSTYGSINSSGLWTIGASGGTQTHAVNGQMTWTGVLGIPDGAFSAAGLAIYFTGDTDTGIYRSGSGIVQFISNGSGVGNFGPGGWDLKGTTTNDSAATGDIGEYMSDTQSAATNVPNATAQFGDTDCQLSITAGDWDLTGTVTYTLNGSTPTQFFKAGISSTSGNSGSGMSEGHNLVSGPNPASGINPTLTIPSYRVSVSGTTTYYLKTYSQYSAGTPQYYCSLTARRVR
jgi:hypothetical protein